MNQERKLRFFSLAYLLYFYLFVNICSFLCCFLIFAGSLFLFRHFSFSNRRIIYSLFIHICRLLLCSYFFLFFLSFFLLCSLFKLLFILYICLNPLLNNLLGNGPLSVHFLLSKPLILFGPGLSYSLSFSPSYFPKLFSSC